MAPSSDSARASSPLSPKTRQQEHRGSSHSDRTYTDTQRRVYSEQAEREQSNSHHRSESSSRSPSGMPADVERQSSGHRLEHTRSHPSDARTVSLHDRLSHFTWAWFECTMATGAIATLLGQLPYTFHGLRTIGKIFFILDLVLFLIFTGLITYRFATNKGAISLSLHHPHESFYFGTFWVSIALIIYCMDTYAVPSCGPWLVKTIEVLFWLYAGLALLVAVFQYHVIFDEEKLPVKEAMPTWILPVYPFVIAGPLAGTLLYHQPQGAAIPILIGGITFQGLGFILAFIMHTIYLTRLVNSDLPEPSKRPGMFVAVGPLAYTSDAMVLLGVQAHKILPRDFLGVTALPVGDVWEAIGVPIGVFLWLVAFWFSALATVSVLFAFWSMKGRPGFSISWWSFVFPNVGLVVAAIQIGNVLASAGIKWVTIGMTIILVILWIWVAGLHIRAVYLREVLWPGMDEDMEDVEGHEETEKDR